MPRSEPHPEPNASITRAAMMADRRRRSPELSRRGQEYRRSEYSDEQPRTGMRSGAESIYSSSSSSVEVIDISHSFPPNRSGIITFFTAPSERRLRKRRSSRLLRHNNSSSDSIGDLAYGHGYLRRPKRMVRSRRGKEIDRERYSERERVERYSARYSDREKERSGIGRAATDAEILAVGAGLATGIAKLAREQNKAAARNGKQVYGVKESGRRDDAPSRGLAPSKVSHGSGIVDEDGWESATDAESESSVDSRLAYGAESQGGWGFFGRKRYTEQTRKSSVVDPQLFGPANSLHGVVTEPVGFGEVSWNSSSDFGQHPFAVPPAETIVSGSQQSMRYVYPIATDDSTRFDAGRSSVVSGAEPFASSRPAPIPIQQPQPINVVSQSVYDPIYATRSDTGTGILKKTPTSAGKGKSIAEAALFGVAGAAVGAAIASERRDDRKERRRDDDREGREESRTVKDQDSDQRDTMNDRRHKRGSPDREERKEKRREKERLKDSQDGRSDKKREKRRDGTREETREERRERRREEKRIERGEDPYDRRRSERFDEQYEPRRAESDTVVSKIAVDPFQYQVDNDTFATPNNEPAIRHDRIQSFPTVVTVEREPDFTRKRSSSIKEQPVVSRSEAGRKDYAQTDERDSRDKDSYRDLRDRPLHEAESIYQQTEHFTAPIDAAAISAAIAAEGYRESRSERRRDERRGERRRDYDDGDYEQRKRDSKRESKDYGNYDRKSDDKESARESRRERPRDPIQEEADRAYREIVMARKIASEVIRSRSPSPNRSVVDKYQEKEEEIVRIVTPPGMDDSKKKGPYDAPNADFTLDYVLEHPREIRRFSLPPSARDLSNSESLYLKKDPDATLPRPLLNLVLPTPSPSPSPEKQISPSDPARSSKQESQATTASDVVIGPKGNVVPSTTTSAVSKGVTWGENETKHFEVESPSEHRDEFVSSPEVRIRGDAREDPSTEARDNLVDQPRSANASKRSGWGAIAAGIIGAGAGAAIASSSDTSKSSKSSKTKDTEKKQDASYEYRGVIVEPESPPRTSREQSPPTISPKPSESQVSQISRVPGSFDDDIDFTATVAAGLQDTGFDPDIVINDPSFRRRNSPPGSNGPSFYQAPYAETVSDLGSVLRDAPVSKDAQGSVLGDVVTTPRDWPTVSHSEEETTSRLTRNEQKKHEKARRQSGDFAPVEEGSKFAKAEIFDEPESYFDEPKKKSKKSKSGSGYDNYTEEASRNERGVAVPVDAFDDLRNGEEDWSETKKSKRKSRVDGDRYDFPSQSAPSDVASPQERRSTVGKKSKDKSKRKSDSYEPEPTEVSLPPSVPSESSRDGDFDDIRRTRKSSNKDSGDRGGSRSVVSADGSRYDDEPRKNKKKSKSRDDFDDTRSVASAPTGDDFDDKKSKKKDRDKRNSGGFFGLFGLKSDMVSRDDTPRKSKDDSEDVKKSKKSKRASLPDASSLYGDIGSQTVTDLSRNTSNGNSNGNSAYNTEEQDRNSRNEIQEKSRSRDESEPLKKDSFLAKAGTLGAGVGLAGAVIAIAAQRRQQSNADSARQSNETAEQTRSRGSSRSRQLEDVDPEITQRQYRPSIDPQYGDLLPLPPSSPESPNFEPTDDLPDLPDSRPDTPEADRLAREIAMASIRKSVSHDATQMKSPSHSAVPLKFFMGSRSSPSSPGPVRGSQSQSPATPIHDSPHFPRSRPRPTSWENTNEYKPLYLVETNRRGSNIQQEEFEVPLPALPPSQGTSRASSQLDSSDEAVFEDAEQYPRDLPVHFEEPLSIDTGLAKSLAGLLDSEQSTPKAGIFQYLDADQSDEQLPEHNPLESSSRHAFRSVSPPPDDQRDFHAKTAADIIAGAAVGSSIAHFASSQIQSPTDKSPLGELPSHSEAQRQPFPVDPMTKDRSSYLLQSSPMSRKTEDDDSAERIEDSPTNRHQPPQFAGDSLNSIQEGHENDVFDHSDKVNPQVEQERERTLNALSGHELPELQETASDYGEGFLTTESRELAAIDSKEEAEPAEQLAFTKSKKGKKKDKKKGKGVPWSSTPEDFTETETSQDPFGEPSAPVSVDTTEEFSLTKSKKDKKKGKGISRTSTQDNFFEEPSRDSYDEPSAAVDVGPTEEFSTTKSKKDKKKDKKRGKSTPAWEPEEGSNVPTADKYSDNAATVNVLEEKSAQDDFATADTKKGKKNDKRKRKSMTALENEVEQPPYPPIDPIQEPANEAGRDILEAAVPVGLGIAAYEELKPSEDPGSSTQHGKEWQAPEDAESRELKVLDFQEQGKPSEFPLDQSSPTQEAREELSPKIRPEFSAEAGREAVEEASVPVNSVASVTEQTKQQAASTPVSAWVSSREPEKEQAAPSLHIQELDLPPSKQSENGKEFQSRTTEEIFASEKAEPIEAPTEKNEDREITKTDINEPPVIESDQIASFQRPATPASPPTGFVEEASNSEYFPSTAALHRPASHKPQSSDDKTGSVYFPSAAAILPVAAAGAAIIAAEHFDKTSDESADPESSSSRVVEGESSRSTEPDTTSARPIPDGLKAGYDSEQLSLARRLQEMFSSGSKKSKKDKKKRQSLSATPDRDVSRSRGPDEASEDHHRARSLSIGPSRAKSSDRPMSEDRKSLYSEDQLEVARNLKAEFESGGKKSKKDKKKRQDLSRNSTQDDYVFNQPIEESQSIEPENIEGLTVQEQAVSSRDGFDAGYQEDQLSLARQLQAEFGSKKSKKDKKRRSTPQTPTQGPELQTDDFAETSQIPIEESSRNLERSGAPEPSVLDTSRDGLAVGYNEDQVELARQLNEEFSSGSKKSKKDKKKRQGLLRNTTEDDFSSDSTPKDVTESRDVEYQDAGSAELQPNEPSPARPEDEFALTGKKSKKDKKRQSLLRNTTEDDFSSDHAPQDGTQPRDFESQNASTVEPGPSEITLTEPDDQSAFTSKKSKKDKKSKKRDSIATATTAEVSSETISNDIEEPPQGYVQEENAITESNAPTPAEAEDEFAFTTKKSKKDKKGKNRESLVPATQNDESPADIAAKDLAETALAGAGIEAVSTEPLAEIPEDEFGLTRKKSRKDKKGQKRDSLLRSTTANDTPSSDDFGKAVEALHNTRDVPSNEHAAASFENDWASSAKSVDAEEREHFTAKEDSWDSPMLNDDSAQFQASEELSTAEVTATSSGTDAVNDSTDGFGFSSKKSKKDKKKRQSLLRSSSTYEDTPEQGNKEADLPQESTSKEIMETAAPALGLAEEQDGVYGSTSKKLKKDKKKRQSSQLSFAEEVPRTVDELSIAQQVPPVVEDFDKDVEERAPEAIISDTSSQRALGDSSLEKVSAEPIEGDAEAQFEKFAFTTKSSKKGKKKRKGSNMPDSDEPSGVSTTINPIDETPAALVESPLPPDIPPESSEAARELWSRQVEESIPVDAAADEILANPADEWESFSSKKYKTDKELPSQWDVAEVKEPKSEKLEDLVDDELGSFNTKKSKKDKKKRKSGLSTSLEALPEPERSPLKEIPKERMEQVAEINADPEPAVPGDLQETKQQEPTERVAETIAEPEPEIPVLDDFQETGQQEPVPTTFGEILHEPTHLEGTSQEPDYDVPKDARDTEELKPVSKEPVPTTFGEILDEAIPQLEVAGSERDFGSQRGTRETEWPKSMSSEPVDDEGASFITNQSRKDKKRSKSDKSTTLRTLAEPESSTSQREVSKVEEPKSQLDELLAGGVFTTKKAKENKNQSEFTVPPEDTSQPEGAFQEFENGIKNPEPQHQESLLRPEAPSHLESREVGETELYRSLENAEEDQEPVFGPEATSHLEAREIQEYESQHSLMSREPEHEESFVEPDVTSHHGSRDIQESELQNSVDDEWAAFTAKKSKKDKETKSGTLKSSGKVPQLESSSQEDQVKDEAVLQQVKEAGEEERGLFTTEKGTGKLGLSTPIEETAPPDIASREEDVDHREVEPLQHKFSTQPNSVEQEQPQSRLFSTETPLLEALQFQPSPTQELVKPQSHLLSGETPPKETTEPVSFTQQDSVEKEELQSQLPSAVNDSTTADIDQARESGQVALEFLSKKSKKDKKKRKSGLSTPAEDTVPSFEREETYKTQLPAFDAPEVQSWPSEPDGGNEQASRDAAFEFMTKKSKKDKKRKSGLSTPVEGKAPSVESESLSREFGFDMPATELSPAERDIFEPQAVQNDSQMQPSGPTDDSFEFTTKKAKKDRKGKKRASLLGSESGPSSSATPSSSTPPIDVSVEDQSHLVSKRLTQSPGTFVKDLSAEQNIAEPDPNSTYPRETPFETQVIESDEVPFDLGRKPSKKDKRKRQAIVANVDDGPSASQTAMATWADEVEDAEAERDVTVSEDIAKDASPSYIASTTETAPIDDFSRSSKKGKKGKKRNSEVMRDSSKEDSFHSRISEDASKQQDAEHSDIPVLVATGAALAGAVCLAKKSEEEVPEPVAATAETEGSMNKAADILSPARKLSKKAKRQQSIDRRAPKDDPFDDPALWEGAQPKAFEELREANNDTGSDGFWSANVDEQVSSEERPQALGNLHTGPVDLFPSDRNERAQEPIDELDLNDDSIPLQPLRELPSSEQGWNDSLDGYIRPSSENNIDEKKQSRLAEWNTPDGHPEVQESDLPPANPTHHMPGVGIDEPHIEQRTPSEPPTISPINFVQELPVDRDISFQDSQFRPRNSLRYSAQGSPSLPVVREESPAQMESNHFHPTSFPPGADDVNRDSAFVTESPIPGQKPFAGESIRDSGVHLREPSPLERAVAPVSMSDDAIARLSWPAVDEALEAVDLHRSQRPKVDTPPAEHHDEETISVQATSSHVPFSEDRDVHLSHTSDNILHRRYEERQSLPSQIHNEDSHTDLHRTQTIRRLPIEEDRRRHRVHRFHGPEDEDATSQIHDAALRDIPLLRHEEPEEPLRHRVHRSDIEKQVKADKSRSEDQIISSLRPEEERSSDLHRTQTIHRSQKPDSLVKQRVQGFENESPPSHRPSTPKGDRYGNLSTSHRSKAEKPSSVSDSAIVAATAIAGAGVGFAAARQASRENRPESAQSQRSSNINRLRTPDPKILRPDSVGSNRSLGTPPLRRSDRKSGDLRSLSQRSNLDLAKEAGLAAATIEASAATPTNPQANEGRVRAKDMADVYDGLGEGRMGSPRSPTRPHSMRRRQSMQVLDLEQRLEQLAAENQALAEAKAQADRVLQIHQHASSALVERDAELDSLKRTLVWLQNEVSRLTEVNDGLTSANITLGNQHNERYKTLESKHAQVTRELQEVRDSNNNLSQGMEGILRNEVENAVQEKDREIAELRAQLEAAKEKIREMQRQILESKAGDSGFLTIRDEDYFDQACQQLCQHVQQWVLRFSKFSDMRACRLTSEINNDKIIDRLDNAILDGSDVDSYLADRIKRRDVFMSMTMTMVWEFVFTRYLFGMDREQRQKLKSLEKLLSEVGPASAVHHWRATTLTLLSKRDAFQQQREQDTLAVVNAILETLTEILPPPSHLEQQIQEQLTRVMKAAVDLSIEMRTQRAEYMMLPPLQPEYDANGDLASKVTFNAALMNERSGDTISNEELEEQKAVVRIVLFPLVVKKGDDSGEGDEEIVVCPAQVLVAKPKKQVRIFSNGSGSQPNQSRVSMQSSVPADYGEASVI